MNDSRYDTHQMRRISNAYTSLTSPFRSKSVITTGKLIMRGKKSKSSLEKPDPP